MTGGCSSNPSDAMSVGSGFSVGTTCLSERPLHNFRRRGSARSERASEPCFSASQRSSAAADFMPWLPVCEPPRQMLLVALERSEVRRREMEARLRALERLKDMMDGGGATGSNSNASAKAPRRTAQLPAARATSAEPLRFGTSVLAVCGTRDKSLQFATAISAPPASADLRAVPHRTRSGIVRQSTPSRPRATDLNTSCSSIVSDEAVASKLPAPTMGASRSLPQLLPTHSATGPVGGPGISAQIGLEEPSDASSLKVRAAAPQVVGGGPRSACNLRGSDVVSSNGSIASATADQNPLRNALQLGTFDPAFPRAEVFEPEIVPGAPLGRRAPSEEPNSREVFDQGNSLDEGENSEANSPEDRRRRRSCSPPSSAAGGSQFGRQGSRSTESTKDSGDSAYLPASLLMTLPPRLAEQLRRAFARLGSEVQSLKTRHDKQLAEAEVLKKAIKPGEALQSRFRQLQSEQQALCSWNVPPAGAKPNHPLASPVHERNRLAMRVPKHRLEETSIELWEAQRMLFEDWHAEREKRFNYVPVGVRCEQLCVILHHRETDLRAIQERRKYLEHRLETVFDKADENSRMLKQKVRQLRTVSPVRQKDIPRQGPGIRPSIRKDGLDALAAVITPTSTAPASPEPRIKIVAGAASPESSYRSV